MIALEEIKPRRLCRSTERARQNQADDTGEADREIAADRHDHRRSTKAHERPAEAAAGVPLFLSYVLSFIYVGIYWNNHHHMLQLVRR